MIRSSSAAMEAAADILKNKMAKLADELEKKVGPAPFVQIRSPSLRYENRRYRETMNPLWLI